MSEPSSGPPASNSRSDEDSRRREALLATRALLLPKLHSEPYPGTPPDDGAQEKSYNDTFLTYLDPLRAHVNEIKPWTSFHGLAEKAQTQWCDHFPHNEIDSCVVWPVQNALSLLDPSDHSSPFQIVDPLLCALTYALRDMSGTEISPVIHYSRSIAHIKTVGGSDVLYSRSLEMKLRVLNEQDQTLLYTGLTPLLQGFTAADEMKPDMTAHEFATHAQEQFVNGKGGRNSFVARLCRLLFAMLHTETLHAWWTNHNQAIFFKADLCDGQLTLYTSDVYTCDGRFRNGTTWLHGILGLLNEIAWEEPGIDKEAGEKLFLQVMDDAAVLKCVRKGESMSNCDVMRLSHERGWEHERWDMQQPELIMSLLRNGREIWEGNWTIVRVANFGKIRAVIKYWNGLGVDGLEQLENEVKIYMTIRSRHKRLLGTLIPWLIAYRRTPREQMAIVTEHVGERTSRYESTSEGYILVGGKRIETNELPGLIAAGERAIAQLHAIGIAHNDVNSRNLRIERVVVGDQVEWKVWLIDFGKSTTEPMDWQLEDDVEQMRICLGVRFLPKEDVSQEDTSDKSGSSDESGSSDVGTTNVNISRPDI